VELHETWVVDLVVNKVSATRMVAHSGVQIIHRGQTRRSSSDPVKVRLRVKGSQVQNSVSRDQWEGSHAQICLTDEFGARQHGSESRPCCGL
jgi:hypothetical protein